MSIKKLIKCPYCKYEWKTKSEMFNITCPNCLRKIRVVKNGNKYM